MTGPVALMLKQPWHFSSDALDAAYWPGALLRGQVDCQTRCSGRRREFLTFLTSPTSCYLKHPALPRTCYTHRHWRRQMNVVKVKSLLVNWKRVKQTKFYSWMKLSTGHLSTKQTFLTISNNLCCRCLCCCCCLLCCVFVVVVLIKLSLSSLSVCSL